MSASFSKFLKHFGRSDKASEFVRFYSAITLRNFAMSIIGTFIPIYLYLNGLDIAAVMLFFVLASVFGIVITPIVGLFVIRYGPKLTLLLSNILSALVFYLITQVDITDPSSFVLLTAIYALSQKTYYLPYNSHFANIINSHNGGHQLGLISNLSSVAGALGPLIGGLSAFLFGGDLMLAIGVAIFLLSALPLFARYQPEALPGGLHIKRLLHRDIHRDIMSITAYSVETSAWLYVWPLFVAVAVFAASPYAGVGIVTTIGILTAIFANSFSGRAIDRGQGRRLYNYSTIGLTLVSLTRPFAANFIAVTGINIASQALSSATTLPILRGIYTRAKSLDNSWISYMALNEILHDFGSTLIFGIIWLITLVVSPTTALQIGLVVSGLITLVMLAQKFPLLSRKKAKITD